MIGDLTIAYAETIGTLWDAEEQSNMENIDMRAVNRFIYADAFCGLAEVLNVK